MARTISKHACSKPSDCRHKTWLGCLALCRISNKECLYCAPNPVGRYESEDLWLP